MSTENGLRIKLTTSTATALTTEYAILEMSVTLEMHKTKGSHQKIMPLDIWALLKGIASGKPEYGLIKSINILEFLKRRKKLTKNTCKQRGCFTALAPFEFSGLPLSILPL